MRPESIVFLIFALVGLAFASVFQDQSHAAVRPPEAAVMPELHVQTRGARAHSASLPTSRGAAPAPTRQLLAAPALREG